MYCSLKPNKKRKLTSNQSKKNSELEAKVNFLYNETRKLYFNNIKLNEKIEALENEINKKNKQINILGRKIEYLVNTHKPNKSPYPNQIYDQTYDQIRDPDQIHDSNQINDYSKYYIS